MSRLLFIVFTFLLCGNIQAQEPYKKAGKVLFFSMTQAGWLRGEAGGAFTVQTVNGVRLRSWSSGIGVGIDQYAMRSVPVFLHLQKQLPLLSPSFSLYLDGGFNFPWPEKVLDGWGMQEQKGLYLDAGLQYHWRIRNNFGPVLSLGYAEKRYSYEQSNDLWCIGGTCPDFRSTWLYTNRRIALKAGFRF